MSSGIQFMSSLIRFFPTTEGSDSRRADVHLTLKCPTPVNPKNGFSIDISDSVFIGRGSIIDSKLSVRIGRDTFIAPHCFITDTQHRFTDSDQPIRMQGCEYSAVEIGCDVWIGAHVVIVVGVTIGRGSVIGANSTVTRDVKPYVVAAGSPARTIRLRD